MLVLDVCLMARYSRPEQNRMDDASPYTRVGLMAVIAGTAWAAVEWYQEKRKKDKHEVVMNEMEANDNAREYVMTEPPPEFVPTIADKHPKGKLAGIKKITLFQVLIAE